MYKSFFWPFLLLSTVQAAVLTAYTTSLSPRNNVQIDFEVLPNETAVEVTVTYDGLAWLAVGTGSSGMPGTTACIAKPEEFTTPRIFDITGRNGAAVTQSATQNLLEGSSFTQTNGQSILKCKAPFDPANAPSSGDFGFSTNGSTSMVVAWGQSNTFGYHGNSNKVPGLSVDLSVAIDAGETDSDGEVDDENDGGEVDDQEDEEEESDDLGDGVLQLDDNLQLFRTANADDTATFTLTYQGEGWVALGLGSQMVGSLAVIGLPDSTEDPQIFSLNAKAVSGVVPTDNQVLSSSSVVQEGGTTVLTFTVPFEREGFFISREGETNYIWAYGSENALSYHAQRRSFSAAIDGGLSVDDPTPYYKAHGYLMALAWGLLCPLAIGASLCRHWFPEGMFFQIHRALNSLVVILTFVAFWLAWKATHIEGLDHFKEEKHRKLGLVIVLFAILQGVGGALRPHLPESKDEEKTMARKGWEIGHRGAGFTILILAWVNSTFGIDQFYLKFPEEGDASGPTTAFWVVATVILGVSVIGFGSKFFMKSSDAPASKSSSPDASNVEAQD